MQRVRLFLNQMLCLENTPAEKIYSSAIKPHLYFPEGKLFEDQFVMYKAMLASNMIVYENANDYYYTIRHASITNQRNRRHLDTLESETKPSLNTLKTTTYLSSKMQQ